MVKMCAGAVPGTTLGTCLLLVLVGFIKENPKCFTHPSFPSNMFEVIFVLDPRALARAHSGGVVTERYTIDKGRDERLTDMR